MYKILKNIIEMDDYSVQKLSKSQPPEPFQWNTVEGTELNVDDCVGGKGKIGVKGNTYQENRILPEGYTQVDYIESHGKEYIDTGVNADSNLRTVLDMAYTEPEAAGQNVGAINMGKGQVRYHIVPQHELFRIYIQNSNFINTISLDTNRHLYDIDVPNHIIKVDKNNYSLNTTSFNVELNFWLFGRNSDSTIYKSKNKLYKCRMYVSGVLVRDFIPCYRNSDNEVGLYDLVNGVFYTNQGTGAFTYGSVVTVPNTDFEIPIKVVTGNNVIRHVGKNLLDLQNKTSEIIILRKLPKKLPAGTYVFSCDDIDKAVSIRLSETNQTGAKFKRFRTQMVADGRRYVTGTIDFDAEYINISSSLTAIENMQLEQGSIPTPYEQYKEKDYKLDLWKENEFDKNNVNKFNAYIDSSNKITSSEATRTLYIECKKNTLYKISKAKSARFRAMYTTDIPAINRVGNGYIINDTGEEIIIKTGNNAKYLCVFYYHANQDTLTEQEILESIQIQEAFELCKIDNYKDVLFKNVVGDENYNAELENEAWYKKKVIDKKFLDGEMYFANSGVTNVFYTPVITNYSRINNKPFCDNFKGFNNVDTASSVTIINSVGFNNTYNYNRLYISFNGTIDELKDFLNEKMPTLYYANDNPTYEKITDTTLISQLEALRKAKWLKGVNHWWTETDNLEPNLKGTYRQAINE